MSKIRVLHVHSGMGGGGTETFIATMAVALQDSCESSLFSLSAGRAYEGPHLPRQDAEHASIGVGAIFRRLLRHVRQWQPDIIHAHFTDAVRYGALVKALSRGRCKLVVHWHNTRAAQSRTPLGTWLGRYAMHQADGILACSNAAADYHGAFHGLPPESVRLIYNPVDITIFDRHPATEDFRRRLGVQRHEVLAVLLSRLCIEVKGLDVLCEAVRLLPNDFPLRVALVGPGDLDAVHEQLQPPEQVILTGPVSRDEVPGVLNACDVCLQPSRSEGLPLSIVEAMAAGLPVIASRVGGIPEVVEDGVTGLLVEPQAPKALAEAIRWMVEHPKEREEMGRRGQERAKRFDVKTIAAQLEEIYREVLDG